MVSTLAMNLQRNRLVTGFGRSGCRPSTRGRGLIRDLASQNTRTLGNFLVDKLASAIAGSGRKRTYKKNVTRTTAGGSFRYSGSGRPKKRRVVKRRTIGTGARTTRNTTVTRKRRVRRVLFKN